jgi:hypothetical protein
MCFISAKSLHISSRATPANWGSIAKNSPQLQAAVKLLERVVTHIPKSQQAETWCQISAQHNSFMELLVWRPTRARYPCCRQRRRRREPPTTRWLPLIPKAPSIRFGLDFD